MQFIHRLSNWFRRISTGWVTLIAFVVAVLFMVIVLPGQAARAEQISNGAGSPDTSFLYTPQELYDIAEVYGPEGRNAYLYARWTFDLVYPLVYGFFLVTSISWLFGRVFPATSPLQLANLVPVLAVLFDFLENTAVSIVMFRFPQPTEFFAWLAPLFTLLKWGFVSASFILLLVGLLGFFWNWFKRRS